MMAEQSLELRVYQENLRALAQQTAGREETAEEANYRHRLEQLVAELQGSKPKAAKGVRR